MQILETIDAMRAYRRQLSGDVAMVPTMGALHAGHMALVDHARTLAPQVVVSIFVNPAQFGPNEDYDRYPRTFDADRQQCEAHQVDAIFAPAVEHMYPPGAIETVVDVPSLTDKLEAANRPGHFQGVCRVVMKLLNMCSPMVAVFGEKDYQQLCVIRAMVADAAIPVQIVGHPTIREADGLAMSSRNRYLNTEQRTKAVAIHDALQHARKMVRDGNRDVAQIEQTMARIIEPKGLSVDYATVRNAASLAPIKQLNDPANARALVAARLGPVRLIDNMSLEV